MQPMIRIYQIIDFHGRRQRCVEGIGENGSVFISSRWKQTRGGIVRAQYLSKSEALGFQAQVLLDRSLEEPGKVTLRQRRYPSRSCAPTGGVRHEDIVCQIPSDS